MNRGRTPRDERPAGQEPRPTLAKHQLDVERHVMTDAPEHVRSRSSLGRRIVTAMILSAVFSLALWVTALNAMTSLLAGAGAGAVILVASSVSDAFETILEAIGGFALGLLAAIGAILGTLFGAAME